MSFKYKTQTNEDEDDAHQEPIYKENRAKSVFHTPHVKFDYVHPTHPILKDTICRRCCRSCTPWRIGLIALLVVLIASVVTGKLITSHKYDGLGFHINNLAKFIMENIGHIIKIAIILVTCKHECFKYYDLCADTLIII